MKIVYLFNGARVGLLEKVMSGKDHGNGFWGMTDFIRNGIDATYLEVEQDFSPKIARLIRKYVPIYCMHLLQFRKILQADIVFTSVSFGTQFVHALWPFKKPVWIMHDFSIMGLLGDESTFRQKLFRFIVSRADGIVTISKKEELRLKERFPQMKDQIRFIPYFGDINFFKPGTEDRGETILAVGADPDRDWKTLIEAMKGLGYKLHLVTRESRVAKLRPLPEFVTVGQHSAQELVSLYARAMLVIIPLNVSGGNNDAMGCSAAFEALSSGCPVVATRTEAMETYIVEGENGLLVPAQNPQALREALVRLVDNKELRLKFSKEARARAVELQDSRNRIHDLKNFFTEILSRSR
jgi:glycosyltransferase involved in cell wall biosynthesis